MKLIVALLFAALYIMWNYARGEHWARIDAELKLERIEREIALLPEE
jgi:hypothetical protein